MKIEVSSVLNIHLLCLCVISEFSYRFEVPCIYSYRFEVPCIYSYKNAVVFSIKGKNNFHACNYDYAKRRL